MRGADEGLGTITPVTAQVRCPPQNPMSFSRCRGAARRLWDKPMFSLPPAPTRLRPTAPPPLQSAVPGTSGKILNPLRTEWTGNHRLASADDDRRLQQSLPGISVACLRACEVVFIQGMHPDPETVGGGADLRPADAAPPPGPRLPNRTTGVAVGPLTRTTSTSRNGPSDELVGRRAVTNIQG